MNNEQSAKPSSDLTWFKSSYSGPNGGDCLEAAFALGVTHIRDSKTANGPVLRIADRGWGTFVGFASGREGIGA